MADFADTHFRVKRISHRNGKALAASDFALSAGFGSTATVAVATGGTDACFFLTITCGGIGQGASPTCTLTFADGAWTTPDGATLVPVAVTSRNGTAQPTIPFSCVCTATTCVLTFEGTALGTEVYKVGVHVAA